VSSSQVLGLRRNSIDTVGCITCLHIVIAKDGMAVYTKSKHEIREDSGLRALDEIPMNIFARDVASGTIELCRCYA
jgi:hypothetical protein